jgi:hypothetical protein
MKPGHTDANQSAIVLRLKQFGASVQDLSAVGGGCVDLLVGFKGRCYALEVKAPGRPCKACGGTGRRLYSDPHGIWCGRCKGSGSVGAGKLNELQQEWHRTWRGQVAVVETPEQALRAIGIEVGR